VWDLLINNPIVNALLLLYGLLGHQFILAIAALTLLIRLVLFPLTLKGQRSTEMMQALQASKEWQDIQKKYKNDREKLSQETMRMYREYGVNPLGGCLPQLIQLPILIGLWQSINRVVALSPLQLMGLSSRLYSFLPGLATLVPLNDRFLWLNLGQPDPYMVLPVLVVVSSWAQQKLLTPPNPDPQAASMNRTMQIMMPLMFGFFAMNFSSGLSIYFVASNVIGLIQYAIIHRWFRAKWRLEAENNRKAVSQSKRPVPQPIDTEPEEQIDTSSGQPTAKPKRKTGRKKRKRK